MRDADAFATMRHMLQRRMPATMASTVSSNSSVTALRSLKRVPPLPAFVAHLWCQKEQRVV
jgi:hypothetical protein